MYLGCNGSDDMMCFLRGVCPASGLFFLMGIDKRAMVRMGLGVRDGGSSKTVVDHGPREHWDHCPADLNVSLYAQAQLRIFFRVLRLFA